MSSFHRAEPQWFPGYTCNEARRRYIMRLVKGKTLFITGASRGIGRAIALRAAADGANIAIASKADESNPKLRGTIQTVGRTVHGRLS